MHKGYVNSSLKPASLLYADPQGQPTTKALGNHLDKWRFVATPFAKHDQQGQVQRGRCTVSREKEVSIRDVQNDLEKYEMPALGLWSLGTLASFPSH